MSQITVRGGKPLNGRVDVKGAKNLVTKAMVAALLGETPSVLKDVPFISDVDIVSRLLQLHGVAISHDENGVMSLDPSEVASARMVDIDAHAGSSRIPILFCARCFTVSAKRSFQGLADATSATAQLTTTLKFSATSARLLKNFQTERVFRLQRV